MANYGVKAKYILNRPRMYRQIIGFSVGMFLILTLEIYAIYNYHSYKYSHYMSGQLITDIMMSFSTLFTLDSFILPFSFSNICVVFKDFLNLWWINLSIGLIMLLSMTKKGNFAGVENGSAHWATKKDRADFQNSENTIPIQDGLYLDAKNKELKNLNEICIGDTGAGKTFRKLIPDILQDIGSYVITDTKGALYRQTAKIFQKRGYDIKILNLYEIAYSNTFNPLSYINPDEEYVDAEAEIDKLVNTFILNSRKDGAEVGDAFWEDTMSMLMTSIISYLILIGEHPLTKKKEEINFARVMDLVVGLEVVKGKILPSSEYEQIMQMIEMQNPYHTSVINYKLFKKSAAETLQSIIISLAARLRFWSTKDIRILTQTDEMNIDEIADRKTVVFIIIPDNDNTYKVISSMFISMLFRRLYHIADHKYNGKLPRLVSLELDEFASIGKVPNYDGYIATMRSRNIRSMIILQNLQQLEKLYEKADKTIVSNSLVFNYLGTNDTDTRKKVVEMLGKTTIQKTTNQRSLQGIDRSSESDAVEGRELLTLDELNTVKNKYSIVFVAGYPPFFGPKIQPNKMKDFDLLGYDEGEAIKNNTDIHSSYEKLRITHLDEYNKYIENSNVISTVVSEEEKQMDEIMEEMETALQM